MAEGGRQPPVINVQLPAINVHYQEGTRFAGDNVGQKTKIQAGEIGQIVIPTSGSNEQTPNRYSSCDVTDDIARMNLTQAMDFVTYENLRRLIHQSKFAEALITLQDISPSQEQQIMMSECYCQLGRPDKALRCIEALQTTMTSSPRPNVEDVIKLVDNCISDSSHIRALILLSCCPKLYKFDSNPNNAVDKLRYCSFKCWKIIEALAKEGGNMRNIAMNVGLKLSTDTLRELRLVSGTDKNEKACMEARCLNYVGISYKVVGKYKEAIGFYDEGLSLMKKTFSSNAAKYQMFGGHLNNIGNAHKYLGDYSKAKSFYLKSLEAYEKAEDWPSDKAKQKNIESTKENMKNTQRKMKK
uniref:uncharacterized protein LOC120342699 n=1 Tax=Styela clava TaxID=7725 RepID=UPI00193ABDF2|nr:uncharacterized protein LOC120342699 [Styela clava]